MNCIKMLSSIIAVCLLLTGCGVKHDTPLMKQDNGTELSGNSGTGMEDGHSDKDDMKETDEENKENDEVRNAESEQSGKETGENEKSDKSRSSSEKNGEDSKSEQKQSETEQNNEANQNKAKGKEAQKNTDYTNKQEQIDGELILKGFTICVDAGHGIADYSKMEAVAPNSQETKPAFAAGTRGINQTEEQLNLKVAKKLEQKLKELGADVYMTRTEAKTEMSNIDRAEFANSINADLMIRIHADGSSNKNTRGISMLVPTNDYINNASLVEKSERAGKIILEEVIARTGAVNRGIIKRSDLTGFNWSKVPVILIEMGFMSNPEEDRLLETDEYQNKIVQGIVNGMVKYFIN
ncbi:MAG TPA: hypothetical protein GXX36_03075 [Clostridiaceae bacterium]|nr:hypothetical protein [Clostridiaceae bacterium]